MTINPQKTSLANLQKLLDPDFVSSNKISVIKLIRQISCEGLKEAKDFVEQIWIPQITGSPHTYKSNFSFAKIGSPVLASSLNYMDENLPPPMYLIGHTYRQLNKETVLIIGATNQNKSYETVYSISSNGETVHRYNRKDFGLVTGTNFEDSDERNLIILD